MKIRRIAPCLVLLFLSFLVSNTLAKEGMKMKISSPVFDSNGQIPKKYTCDGSDVNPPLTFENIPSEAKSLALIVDDPDAPRGTWVHWVLWNIDPKVQGIRENTLPKGALQGVNDFRKHEYGGPCPPSGTHRYFFKIYALNTSLTLGANTTKADLEGAMKGHIIAQAEIIGLYKRK